MKRVLADLFFLASVCSATLLALVVLIVCFGVPNTVGLDRRPILSAGAAVLGYLARSKESLLWSGLILLLAIPLAVKLIASFSRFLRRPNSPELRLQRAIRLH